MAPWSCFAAESDEPTRVHNMQLWRTPFMSDGTRGDEAGSTGSLLEKIGNAELVRGISDCLGLSGE